MEMCFCIFASVQSAASRYAACMEINIFLHLVSTAYLAAALYFEAHLVPWPLDD